MVKFVFWFCVHHFLCYSQVFPALCSPRLVSVSIIFSVVRQFCLCLHRSVNFMCFSLSRVIFVIVSSVQFASLVLVNWFGSPEPCCPQLCRFPWLSHVYLSPQFLSVLYHVVAPPSSIVPSLFCYEISSSFAFLVVFYFVSRAATIKLFKFCLARLTSPLSAYHTNSTQHCMHFTTSHSYGIKVVNGFSSLRPIFCEQLVKEQILLSELYLNSIGGVWLPDTLGE